jgi:flagellar M-ring protein FliF
MVIVDSVRPPEIAPPSMSSKAMAWIGNYWTSLAMLGVAMFSLLVLRSIATAAPPAGSPQAVAANSTLSIQADEEPQSAGSDAGAPERTRLRIKKGVSLKDDLVEMVHEDPDGAAAILRTWIGKAA